MRPRCRALTKPQSMLGYREYLMYISINNTCFHKSSEKSTTYNTNLSYLGINKLYYFSVISYIYIYTTKLKPMVIEKI